MAETLEGKVVLITGAGGRIGLGMAQAFHAAGALVALGDLHQDTIERAAADLGGKRTFAGVVDVRDAASVRNFFAAAEGALGQVDIAVANAGVFPTLAVLDMEVEEWDRVIEINLRGTFLTCQAAARINVNCIAPGYIQSEGAVANSDFQRALLSNIPWGRFGTPADVAQITLFLASSAADYVTGEVFAVNGGAIAGRMYLPVDPATAR